MDIDLRTLATVLVFISFLHVIALFVQYRVHKLNEGLGFWTLGSVAWMLGFIFNSLRNHPGFESTCIVLNNALFVGGFLLYYAGIRKFLRMKTRQHFLIAFWAGFMILVVLFTLITDNLWARRITLSIALSGVSFLCAASLFNNKNKVIFTSARFLFSVFLLSGLFFILRIITTILNTQAENVFSPTFMQTTTYFIALFSGTLGTFGFIIMLNQRLNAENLEVNQNLELIFNTSPDALIISQIANGVLVRVNDGFSALTGYSRSEVIGKPVAELTFWKDRTDREKLVAELNKKGFCENLEFCSIRKDGTERVGLLSAKIIHLQGIPHIISVTRDITGRKQVEQILVESEERFRLLLDSTAEAIYGLDNQGNCTFCNASALRMLRFSHKTDLIGKNMHYLIHHTHNDGSPFPVQECKVFKAFYAGQKSHADDEYFWRGDGTAFPAEYWSYPIFHENAVIGAVVTFMDITDRKHAEEALRKSEQQFKMLTESMKDVVWTLDTETLQFLYVSPAVQELRGFTPEEIMAVPMDYALAPHQRAKIRQSLNKNKTALLEGKISSNTYFVDEVEQPCKNGSMVWTEVITYFWLNEETGNVEVHGVTRDITERRQMEKALRENEVRLRELNATKDKFFSIIAHDLRSPFHSFLNMSDILNREIDELTKDEIRKFSKDLNMALHKQFDLLNDLLDWSRLHNKNFMLNSDTIFLNAVVDKVCESFDLTAKQKGIMIENQIAEDVAVFADVNMIKLVFRNLISNSMKFSHASGIITVSARMDGGFVEAMVADNGIGIPDEDIPKLFNDEYHFTTTGTKKEKGTGLGLMLCKEIVQKHGGIIRVESKLNVGSTFSFTIPLPRGSSSTI